MSFANYNCSILPTLLEWTERKAISLAFMDKLPKTIDHSLVQLSRLGNADGNEVIFMSAFIVCCEASWIQWLPSNIADRPAQRSTQAATIDH